MDATEREKWDLLLYRRPLSTLPVWEQLVPVGPMPSIPHPTRRSSVAAVVIPRREEEDVD